MVQLIAHCLAVLCISTSFWVLRRNIFQPKITKKVRSQSENAEKRKNVKKVKNQLKKDNFVVPPQGVDQL